MKQKVITGTVLCAVLSVLSGCVNNVQVKDVQQDKQGFLSSNFAPSNLTTSVHQTVVSADGASVNFNRIVYQIDWANNVDNKDKANNTTDSVTLTNAGNGLVQVLVETSRNGVPISQEYMLSYRNYLSLKLQAMNLGANIAPMQMEVKSFQHFDPITSMRSSLAYSYEYGTSVQILNYRSGRTACDPSDALPASELNPTLSGEAREMICQYYNQNGVLQSKVKYAYLDKYGVALPIRVENSAAIDEGKIVSLKAQ
jgi:hypothetical protein